MIDYKEKYELAIARAKNFIENGDERERTIAESIFAGIMEESKDERIRKALMQNLKERFGTKGNMGEGLDMPDVLAWLEKQASSHLSWSEEDERIYQSIIDDTVQENQLDDKQIDWLKSLKDKAQPKQEILEKLEEWLDEYVSDLADVDTASLICSFTNYLDGKLPKSLRPQSTWKPSGEQIKVLEFFIPYVTKCSVVLQNSKDTLLSLLSDLKKLRGE